jgi:AcrR family transcriptional regulator
MAIERQTFHHHNLEAEVLRVARERIETDGVESISLRGLAVELGVNHRALYRHFADKENIIRRVADVGFTELMSACGSAANARNSPLAFADVMAAYAHYALTHTKLYTLMFSLPLSEEFGINSALGARLREMMQVAESTSTVSGEPATDRRTRVIRTWAVVHGLLVLYKSGALIIKDDDDAQNYIRRTVLSLSK